MSKASDKILRGLEEALEYAKGKDTGALVHTVSVPDGIDVKAIRRSSGLSQSQFAKLYGFNLASLQAWEQGRRNPGRTARILLCIVEKDPSAVRRALAA